MKIKDLLPTVMCDYAIYDGTDFRACLIHDKSDGLPPDNIGRMEVAALDTVDGALIITV